MLRLSTSSTIWILMPLLLHLVVTEIRKYPNQNVSSLALGEASAYDTPGSSRKSLPASNQVEGVESIRSNDTRPLENAEISAGGDFAEIRKRPMDAVNERTLADYNGPAIMEYLDDKSARQTARHVRAKRSERPTSSIVSRRCDNCTDSDSDLSASFSEGKSHACGSTSKFTAPFASCRSSDVVAGDDKGRYKRGVLSKSGERAKRVKGNTKRARHRVGIKGRGKKHDPSRASRDHLAKKAIGSNGGKRKTGIAASVGSIGRSRVSTRKRKRESLNSDTSGQANTLIDRQQDTSPSDKEQQRAVALPFVHTEKAELRIRIEHVPANDFAFTKRNDRHDEPPSGRDYSTTWPKYAIIDNAIDAGNASKSNCHGGRESDDGSAVTIAWRKRYERDRSNEDASRFRNTLLHNAKLPSDDASVAKSGRAPSKEDEKSRAKRNQELSVHPPDHKIAMASRDTKDAGEKTPLGCLREEITKRGGSRRDRAAGSIEEIKELAERLVVKVNELQEYVSKRSMVGGKKSERKGEDPYVAGACIPGKSADCLDTKETTRISSESKVTRQIGKRHQHRTALTSVEKRPPPMTSSSSRFARGGYQRKSHRKWGRWMDWSSCSVTCGRGRQIRWRHCSRDCEHVETEMEEKACQLPACPPGKFLGIF